MSLDGRIEFRESCAQLILNCVSRDKILNADYLIHIGVVVAMTFGNDATIVESFGAEN